MSDAPPGGPPPPDQPAGGPPPPPPPGQPPPGPPGWGQPPPPGQPPPGPPPPGYAPGQAWGQPPPPGYQPSQPPYWQPRRTEGTAVGALICGISSFVICPVIPAIVGLILASTARQKIADSRGALEGESLCTVATILSWVNIALAGLGLIVLVIVLAVAANDENGLGLLASALSG